MTDKEKLKYQQFYNYIAGKSEVPMGYTPAGNLSEREAFDVYSGGYKARLTEALGETYDSIWQFTGDQIFFEICGDYIRLNPSASYNLNDYGFNFPEYLRSLSACNDYPFLPDLAALDRNRSFLFHQKFELGIDGETIKEKLKENSQLSFVSSFSFYKSEFDVVSIWKDLRDQSFSLAQIDKYNLPGTVLIFKSQDQVKLQRLSLNAFTGIQNLYRGVSLTESLADLASDEVTELFQVFMLQNLIRNII